MASNQNVTMNPTAGLQSSYGRVFDGFEQERRGLFDGLSVPHSIKATVIAAVGLLVYYLGVRGIEEGFGVPGTTDCRLIAGMLGNLTARAGAFGGWLARQGFVDFETFGAVPVSGNIFSTSPRHGRRGSKLWQLESTCSPRPNRAIAVPHLQAIHQLIGRQGCLATRLPSASARRREGATTLRFCRKFRGKSEPLQ